jgi:hypothetical protein
MFNKLVCKIKSHTLKKAGSCPFTGKSYDVCTRCLRMVEVNNE